MMLSTFKSECILILRHTVLVVIQCDQLINVLWTRCMGVRASPIDETIGHFVWSKDKVTLDSFKQHLRSHHTKPDYISHHQREIRSRVTASDERVCANMHYKCWHGWRGDVKNKDPLHLRRDMVQYCPRVVNFTTPIVKFASCFNVCRDAILPIDRPILDTYIWQCSNGQTNIFESEGSLHFFGGECTGLICYIISCQTRITYDESVLMCILNKDCNVFERVIMSKNMKLEIDDALKSFKM